MARADRHGVGGGGMSAAAAVVNTEDLEALFDSIVASAKAPAPAAAKAAPAPQPAEDFPGARVINCVGRLTRQLHDTLCELGYDETLRECAAAAIPDARQRLAYVVTMTEQAASRTLNAIEVAQPIQQGLGADAAALAARWDALYANELGVDEFRALAADSREFMRGVPERTRATDQQLHEIMMAQDFQDLTGQVIKKVTVLAQNLEEQLLKLLVENTPPEKRARTEGLLNGPVVDGVSHDDVVTSQKQVDDLLEQLGF
jgi:chemotaxis protein CheZ